MSAVESCRPLSMTIVMTCLAVMIIGCSQTQDDPLPGEPQIVFLEPAASSSAPMSYNNDIALVSEEIGCIINSYEHRIRCTDRDGSVVGVFGREGDGPGEFRGASGVERGPDGTVAVIDLRLKRISFFLTNGTFESAVSMPGAFFPQVLVGTRAFGEDHFKNVDFSDIASRSPDDMFRPTHMGVDVASGEIVWERSDIRNHFDLECGRVVLGMPDPRGGYVFRACQELLVFLEDRDDTTATVVASPTYVEELPNQRDVDEYMEGLARLAGSMAQAAGGVSVARSAMEPYASGYREDPKKWFLTGIPFKFDRKGRLWVGTTRDRDAYSYLDVWIGTEYVGTVRIRDRLVGYDVLGSTLAALVQRAPRPDGIAQRAIDWYDISEVRLGR